MGLFDFLYAKPDGTVESFEDFLISIEASKLNVKEFAINKAAGMIARVIAKAEFQVYRKKGGKILPVVDDIYYRLNIRPNPNQTGTLFWTNVLMKMLTDPNGALVIIEPTGYYLADSFTATDSVNYPKSFSDVKVGTIQYNKKFSIEECLYFPLGDIDIKNHLNQFFSEVGEMLAFAAGDYKAKNSKKWTLHVPSQTQMVDSATGQNLKSQDYADKIGAQLNSAGKSVLALDVGTTLNELTGAETKTSQDFRDLLKSCLESAAFAYHIPQDIFFGDKTEKSTSIRDFITFACDPLFEIIEDEFNAKVVSKEEYLKGVKIKADKSRVQHVDFFDTADAEYKLIGCGYSPDEIRKAKGLEPLNEPWSIEHYITKNNEKGGGNG